MTIRVLESPDEFAASRAPTRGLVPTMGALHAGHLALVARAAAENDAAVVSIFVNPSQFGDAADLARYPRDLDTDMAMAASAGASIIYAPRVSTVYPAGFSTWVDPGALATRWEGGSRPGHFRGVATVVSILLNTVRPVRSYFGEKDFQQLQIIRRMHRDLRLPGDIVASPTVRDMDGLALSSRNARLSVEGRRTARKIPRALAAIADGVRSGLTSPGDLEHLGRTILEDPALRLDYLSIVHEQDLEPATEFSGNLRVLVAAEVEGVRLIDNVALPVREDVAERHAVT